MQPISAMNSQSSIDWVTILLEMLQNLNGKRLQSSAKKCCRNRPENIAEIGREKFGRKMLQISAEKCCFIRPRKVRPRNVAKFGRIVYSKIIQLRTKMFWKGFQKFEPEPSQICEASTFCRDAFIDSDHVVR